MRAWTSRCPAHTEPNRPSINLEWNSLTGKSFLAQTGERTIRDRRQAMPLSHRRLFVVVEALAETTRRHGKTRHWPTRPEVRRVAAERPNKGDRLVRPDVPCSVVERVWPLSLHRLINNINFTLLVRTHQTLSLALRGRCDRLR